MAKCKLQSRSPKQHLINTPANRSWGWLMF